MKHIHCKDLDMYKLNTYFNIKQRLTDAVSPI